MTIDPRTMLWKQIATVQQRGDGYRIAWSPSGTMIMYTARDSSLWVMTADGGDKRRLATRVGGDADWQPVR